MIFLLARSLVAGARRGGIKHCPRAAENGGCRCPLGLTDGGRHKGQGVLSLGTDACCPIESQKRVRRLWECKCENAM